MPELIGLILSQYIAGSAVDTVVCCAVCCQWNCQFHNEDHSHGHCKSPRQAPSTRTWLSMQMAAQGSLAVLQWARANGCPWDEDTCASAVAGRPP
jgi:hypothetical protein